MLKACSSTQDIEGHFQVETLLEQGSAKVMEDRLVETDDVFAVLDGATSLYGKEYQGKTGGEWAAEIGAKYLKEGSHSLSFQIHRANIALKKVMHKAGCDLTRSEGRWSASLVAIRVLEDKIEWAQLGDCRILFLYKDGSYSLAHTPEDHDRETLDLMAELGGREVAMADPRMKKQLCDVRRGANRNYGVLNGDAQAVNFLKSGYADLENVSDVIIFTDGFVLPGREEVVLPKTVSLYREGGLTAVYSCLRNVQGNDSSCIAFPRFKKNDDVAAISLKFNSL